MKNYGYCFFFLVFIFPSLKAQIDPENITIARDQWGVPHIFAPTDAEVAYGLAWATAEDDFNTIQQQLLPIKQLAGLVNGKSGAILDVAVHILDAKSIVESRYELDLSLEFRQILDAYAAGANAYANQHPKQVLHKKLFPISGKDIIEAYVLGMSLMSGVDRSLSKILSGEIEAGSAFSTIGSNAIAISKTRTAEGKTYLAINSHQPLEGLNSWYEVHVCSEEGWNMLGSNFAGGVSVFQGTNEYLGWAHTVNYADFADIYELKRHPEKEGFYYFDGKWEALTRYHTKARVKLLGFLKIGVKQKFYQSKYGVTFKTDKGYFSLRFPANRNIQAAEQWYRMNKARNFSEFKKALEMQGIISTNIVYADREDNIYYISNGRLPIRDPHYNWAGVLPGDTSATLWADHYFPIDSLPQVLNPASGYVFNCNNTPFFATGTEDNPVPKNIPFTTGYQSPDQLTNRAVQLDSFLRADDQLNYVEFKAIKYDQAYHKPLYSAPKLEPIFTLNPKAHPQIAPGISLLKEWDRVASENSPAASIFMLSLKYVRKNLKDPNSLRKGDELNESMLAAAIQHAQDHLIKHFGQIEVPLGQLQRHIRGEIDLPFGGGPDVLAAADSQPLKDGRFKVTSGESYIELVRFSPEGVEIESVNAYGASAHSDSPHYTDQMELFTRQQLKPMTLDKALILKDAVRVYHPFEL